MQYFPILAPSKSCWLPVGKYPLLNDDAVFLYIYIYIYIAECWVLFLAFHKVGCCV